ncbi:MAG TPA: DUF6519 domain-containing protein [Pyrinomonadaceae bacterium]
MGDFSRNSYDQRKHYSGVLMQQGRVQLDADWNEQLAIQLHRAETEARDVIGLCGVPKKNDGFKIALTPNGLDLTISAGRIYVDGLLCELGATSVLITFVQGAPNQAIVESLSPDNQSFKPGQWVEISAANKSDKKLLRIIALNPQTRRLTFDANILDYQNAGQASVRRLTTYLTQPDYPNASFTSYLFSTLASPVASPLPSPPLSPPKSPLSSPPKSPLASPPKSPPASPLTSPPQSPPLSILSDGFYVVFLDVWKRECTALDDAQLREVALGGPDTTTRLKNVWQVKFMRVTTAGGGEPECASKFKEWDDYTAPSTGRLNARSKRPTDQVDPCLLPPTAGFTRLENQLYRVEVHQGGDLSTATFSWSRDNAVVRARINKVDSNGSVITVNELGKDEVMSFSGDQWVEITDEESILRGVRRQLVQIASIDPTTREITLKTSVANLAGRENLQLVRWEQSGNTASATGVSMNGGAWLSLEDGVEAQFSEGQYHTGDYWLIPARTATGDVIWPPFEVPNNAPVPQLPLGIKHHYCRLALLEVRNGAFKLKDCRKRFPSLTEICAEDICVDNTACDLPDVNNLQDMIDRLCAARDLRWHNKHLHGWGIVCGLQLECGPDPNNQQRRHVTVRPGYALDCEGNDIVLEEPDKLDLMQMAEQLNPNPAPGTTANFIQDAEYCLILERGSGKKQRYRLEKYVAPKNQWQSIFDGTLLMDFYEDCVKHLVDLFRDEFMGDPNQEQELVGPIRRRVTAFTNLFIQQTNTVNGSYVFLSGEKGQTDLAQEHGILRDSYFRIRGKLQSHTFCAMFEGARQFPEYPFSNTGIKTIFSKGSQSRVRVNGNRAIGYTLGTTNKINVFNLKTNEMVDELVFPGGTSAIVQDVAFSNDGKQLYAVATLNNTDTMFAIADIISDREHTWGKPTLICDVVFVTLGTSTPVLGTPIGPKLYAVGLGKGLYEIDPKNVNTKPTPRAGFNAIGHMAISNNAGFAFLTNGAPGQTALYNSVVRINLRSEQSLPAILLNSSQGVPATGRDDIALMEFPQQQQVKLYAVINPPAGTSTKRLLVFNNVVSPTFGLMVDIDLEEDTNIRLAHNPMTGRMLVVYDDSYRVALLNSDDRLERSFRQPVQISPRSIAVVPERKQVYVLNFASNTLTAIPADSFQPSRQLDLLALRNYRAAVLEAFYDLLGALLQYLKDCFCDHLLVNCPTCDEDDKLYLGCVRIQNNQVFKVCNFSLRKDVYTFPKVKYWLSIVPVIPLFGKLVEMFCCAVLPNYFGNFKVERDTETPPAMNVGANRIKSDQIYKGVTYTKQTDIRADLMSRLSGLTASSGVIKDAIVSAFSTAEKKTRLVSRGSIIGLSTDEARQKLEAANISVVRVEEFDPSEAARNLARFAFPVNNVQEGSHVTLVEKAGVVHHLEVSPGDSQDRGIVGEQKEASAVQAELGKLREALSEMQQSHAAELASRDEEISELRESTKESRINLEEFQELREQVRQLTTVVRVPTTVKESDEATEEKPRRERRNRNTEQHSGKQRKATEARPADETQTTGEAGPPDTDEPKS